MEGNLSPKVIKTIRFSAGSAGVLAEILNHLFFGSFGGLIFLSTIAGLFLPEIIAGCLIKK